MSEDSSLHKPHNHQQPAEKAASALLKDRLIVPTFDPSSGEKRNLAYRWIRPDPTRLMAMEANNDEVSIIARKFINEAKAKNSKETPDSKNFHFTLGDLEIDLRDLVLDPVLVSPLEALEDP